MEVRHQLSDELRMIRQAQDWVSESLAATGEAKEDCQLFLMLAGVLGEDTALRCRLQR